MDRIHEARQLPRQQQQQQQQHASMSPNFLSTTTTTTTTQTTTTSNSSSSSTTAKLPALNSQSQLKKIRNPPWWNRRTRMERRLLVLAGVFFAACAALVVVLAASSKSNNSISTIGGSESMPIPEALSSSDDGNAIDDADLGRFKPTDDVCLTKGCVRSAADLIKSMDESVNPCDNFYQFACGGFIKSTVIPDDKTQMTTFGILNDRLEEQVRILVEEPAMKDEPKPFALVRNLYQSCMNRSLLQSKGLEPIKQILQKLGGWPVLEGDAWDPSSFTWKDSVYKFRQHGYSVDYFIDFSVTTDVKNSTYRIIDLDQPALGLSREYLMKGPAEPEVQAYAKYQVELAVLLGADRDRAEKEMRAALEFERQLANFSLPREERRNVTKLYNPMTVSELQEKYQSIPWLEYFNTLLPNRVRVRNEETVIVTVPSYLEKFEKFIATTDKRTQANYVMWRGAAASVSYLNEAARKLQLDYSSALTGKNEREPRWKECVGVVTASLSNAVGSLYVRHNFKQESRGAALEMVSDIQRSFLEILNEIDWMDETTKERAREKASSMATHIGYPVELLDNSKLENLYDGLEMSSDSYLENVLNLTSFGTDYAYNKLREEVNKTDWITHGRPAIVNAFYAPLENSIQFPAGILQGIFFSNDRPRYMNYGAIGWVIGHEITHGFDDQGRQFDTDGNLYDWWQATTKESYLQRAQCIIWQYGNYSVPELNLKLNGINTQGENIADNGGIKEAYRAYQSWISRNGREPKLPGLNYTPNQLFWISAANVWCNKYRPESLKLRILTGVHSPGEFRVRGPFSNMKQFAEDFNCPAGSNMNPEKKCYVW